MLNRTDLALEKDRKKVIKELEKNIKYYEKFGFKEAIIPEVNVKMWFMLRDNSKAIKQNRIKF